MKNRDENNIDKLFQDALSNHSTDAPKYVWDKVKTKRTLFYIFLNHIRVNGNRYLALAGSAAAIVTAAIIFWPDENVGQKQLVQTENRIVKSETQSILNESNKPTEDFQSDEAANQETIHQQAVRQSYKKSKTEKRALNKSDSRREKIEKQQADASKSSAASSKSDENAKTDTKDFFDKGVNKNEEENHTIAKIEIEEPSTPILPEEQQTQTQQNKEDLKLLPEAQRNWELELALGYGFGQRNLADKGKSNAAAYITNRKQSEQVANTYNLNLLVNYRLPSQIKLSTGINIFAINEKVNFEKAVYSTRTEERIVKGYILDPINGPTAYSYTVIDTIRQTSFETKNRNNQYVFVDIPVLLSHTVWQNNKWEMSLRGGVLFNLAFVQRGAILGGDGIDLAELGSLQAPMKNRADLSYVMAIQGVYRFNEKIAVLFEPNYRLGSGNLFDSGFGIAQKFSSFNTNVGLRYRF